MPDAPTDRALYEEKRAVIERIKRHIGIWEEDKRMRIFGRLLLREIDRIETEEAERTLSQGR